MVANNTQLQAHNGQAQGLNAHGDKLLESSLGRHRDMLASERQVQADRQGKRRQGDNLKIKRDFPFGANRRAQVCVHSLSTTVCLLAC
jgi:ABC-type sulfate transport system substrate-binding protein